MNQSELTELFEEIKEIWFDKDDLPKTSLVFVEKLENALGQCERDEDGYIIKISKEVLTFNPPNLRALLVHELMHAAVCAIQDGMVKGGFVEYYDESHWGKAACPPEGGGAEIVVNLAKLEHLLIELLTLETVQMMEPEFLPVVDVDANGPCSEYPLGRFENGKFKMNEPSLCNRLEYAFDDLYDMLKSRIKKLRETIKEQNAGA